MTAVATNFKSLVSMQPGVAGSPEHSSLAFSHKQDKLGFVQLSHLIVISEISKDGKLITVSPLGGDCPKIKQKVDLLGKSTLLGTVEIVGEGKLRFTAFSAMMNKLAAGDVNVTILGTDSSLGKVTIRKSLEANEYKFLLEVFKANADKIGT